MGPPLGKMSRVGKRWRVELTGRWEGSAGKGLLENMSSIPRAHVVDGERTDPKVLPLTLNHALCHV